LRLMFSFKILSSFFDELLQTSLYPYPLFWGQ
jgi:hypothetical protein